eukprot:3936695-Rhodomonas_salina.1
MLGCQTRETRRFRPAGGHGGTLDVDELRRSTVEPTDKLLQGRRGERSEHTHFQLVRACNCWEMDRAISSDHVPIPAITQIAVSWTTFTCILAHHHSPGADDAYQKSVPCTLRTSCGQPGKFQTTFAMLPGGTDATWVIPSSTPATTCTIRESDMQEVRKDS